jgi:hypothetical protein
MVAFEAALGQLCDVQAVDHHLRVKEMAKAPVKSRRGGSNGYKGVYYGEEPVERAPADQQ